MAEIDVEDEVTRFVEEVASIRARSRGCVERFRAMPDEDVQLLFAERLGGLGSMVVADLYELVLEDPSSSPSQRYLAAWVAVRLGDRGPAVDHLCREVTSGSRYALPAANTLAHLRLRVGVEPVTAAISSIDPERTADLVEWAFALQELGGKLPREVRHALEANSSHPGARAVLDRFA